MLFLLFVLLLIFLKVVGVLHVSWIIVLLPAIVVAGFAIGLWGIFWLLGLFGFHDIVSAIKKGGSLRE